MVDVNVLNNFVLKNFSKFGVSKQREIKRLLFEIAKREDSDYQEIVDESQIDATNFLKLKDYLIKRRFPNLSKQRPTTKHSFPEVDINPEHSVDTARKFQFQPKRFVIEDDVLKTEMVNRIKKMFPDAQYEIIKKYKDYIGKVKYGIKDYNNRTKTVYVINEQFDFFKSCPCSNNSVYCGYHVVNLGSGCPLECTYCYLQDFINSPGIILPANIEGFFQAFRDYKQDIRVGSGELTDSLVFDHITGFSPRIVEFFKSYPKSIFEFKTKTNNIDLLKTVTPAGNIVISWTVNPQKITENVEFYTASINERIKAAKTCAELGYKIVFHFDPIIYYEGWQKDYESLVNQIFDQVPNDAIVWISLGTLRMTPRLKKIIENRFPETDILNEEFMASHDTKLRYSDKIRSQIYTNMRTWIQKRSKSTPIYLCMEEKTLCKSVEIMPSKELINA